MQSSEYRDPSNAATYLDSGLFLGSQSASVCILAWYVIRSMSRLCARSHTATTSFCGPRIVVVLRSFGELNVYCVATSYRCTPVVRFTTVELSGLSERNVTFMARSSMGCW